MQGVAGDDSHCPDSIHGWPMCHDCPEQWFQYGLMYSKCDNVRAPSRQKRSLTDRLTFDSTINTLHLLQQKDEQNSIKNRTVSDRLTESSATLDMTWLRMGPGTEQKGPGLWADARASKSSKIIAKIQNCGGFCSVRFIQLVSQLLLLQDLAWTKTWVSDLGRTLTCSRSLVFKPFGICKSRSA